VEALGIRLTDEAQMNVWLDRWVLVPGSHWQQDMAKGLDQARCCAVCIGTHTPKGWFREEIEKALNRQTKEPSFRVIPVILPGGDRSLIDDFLELRTWVDFGEGIDDGRAFHLLTSGIKGIPPGRYSPKPALTNSTVLSIRENLSHIRELRHQKLIDEPIALEYQRRLLDQLIGPGVSGDV
jgi:hypothetical protein